MSLTALVSVVTPAYNARKSIEAVVRAVARQGSVVLEHIVVDDGSTDDTLAQLRLLQMQFGHLHVYSQTNQGAAAARNRGILEAKGRYIAFLDSDDQWLDGKLEEQITFMETRNVPLTFGDYDAVDAHTGEVLARYGLPESLSYWDLLRGCPIGCLTVAYNQEFFGKRYMPSIRRGQDWALWLALTKHGVAARKYPGLYAVYNVSRDSLSSNKLKKLLDIYAVYRVEEQLGFLSSLYYLFKHATYAMTKTWRIRRSMS